MTSLAAISYAGIVPVIVIDNLTQARGVADALLDAGMTCVELTLRTPAALAALEIMAEVDGLTVGAGTVLEPEQVAMCRDAGATFIVSPGYDQQIVDACAASDLLCLPGTATATEVQRARRQGLRAVKFFPAEQSGGVAAIRALSAALPGISFMPTGGIGPDNAGDYLRCQSVVAIGASWITPRGLILTGDFERIRSIAAQARQRLNDVRAEDASPAAPAQGLARFS